MERKFPKLVIDKHFQQNPKLTTKSSYGLEIHSQSNFIFLLNLFPASRNNWVKVFKNGPSKICGRQPLKNLKCYGLHYLTFFKGCLPQILLSPFLNTMTQI